MTISYLLHPNGRGRLYDDAEANQGTFIDKSSSASGMAKLRDCRLVVGSRAEESCQIYGGQYLNSTIAGHTICAGDPRVFNSTLRCSEVSGTPQIWNSDLVGTTEVCDSPVLNGVIAKDTIIYGDPKITGTFTVTGRIHEGVWLRPPKHIKLPWAEMTECVDGKLILACRCRTIDYWLRHGTKLARRWDWSDDQISVTTDTIRREFPQQTASRGLRIPVYTTESPSIGHYSRRA